MSTLVALFRFMETEGKTTKPKRNKKITTSQLRNPANRRRKRKEEK
jgi:hypothetical protein